MNTFVRLLVYAIAMASTSIQAQICYMASEDTSVTHHRDVQHFIHTIQSETGETILNSRLSTNEKRCRNAKLFIAIKLDSIKEIHELFGNANILAALSSKQEVLHYRSAHPEQKFSAIFTDVSPLNNIAMIKSTFPQGSRFLYLRQNISETNEFKDIKQISKHLGVNLIGSEFGKNNTLFETIAWHDRKSNINGVVIDSQVNLNRETLINLIRFCYHKRLFLVGASPSIAQSGALIASYSTLSDHARHIGEISNNVINYGARLSDEYPKYFNIDINYNLARSFNLRVPEKIDAYNKIKLVLNQYIDGGKYVAVR